jgi:hypothetical protein
VTLTPLTRAGFVGVKGGSPLIFPVNPSGGALVQVSELLRMISKSGSSLFGFQPYYLSNP